MATYYSCSDYTLTSEYDVNAKYYILSAPFYEAVTITPDSFSTSSYYTKEDKYIVASNFNSSNLYYTYSDGIYVPATDITQESFP